MSGPRKIDMERYNRMKKKGLISPRGFGRSSPRNSIDGGSAAVVASKSLERSNSLTRASNSNRSMMPIASAYHDAPQQSSTLLSAFACGALGEDQSTTSNDKGHKTADTRKDATQTSSAVSRERQLTNSLFDEAKRQRYERFKSRVRNSDSPQPSQASTAEARQDKEDSKKCRQADSKRIPSQDAVEQNRRSPYAPPERGALAHTALRTKAQQAAEIRSQRSAFSIANGNSHDEKVTGTDPPSISSDGITLPAPPSCGDSLSSHPLNTYGLPIASASHDSWTSQEQQKSHDSSSLYQTIDKTAIVANNLMGGNRGQHRQIPPSSPNATTKSQQRRQSPVPSDMMASREKPGQAKTRRTPPPQSPRRAHIRNKPSLVVNPHSTPTAMPPPITYSSSSERGVTPPPMAPSNRTPRSVASSSASTSTTKRDRILEARGIPQDVTHGPTKSLQQTSGSRKHMQRSPSLDLPSLNSHYSAESPSSRVRRNATDRGNSTTPVSFYRFIAAEKTQRATKPNNSVTESPVSEHSMARAENESSRRTPPSVPQTKMSPAEGYRQLAPSAQQRYTAQPVKYSPMHRSESPRNTAAQGLDQRTVRLLYSDAFAEMINMQEQAHHFPRGYRRKGSTENRGLSIVIRKRPFLTEEFDQGDFDVVSTSVRQEKDALVVYKTSMADLKKKHAEPQYYKFDHVLSDQVPAEDFYLSVARDHVMKAQDGESTMFVFVGAKGSGKTHSMEDIEERAVFDLFSRHGGSMSVSIQYLQLLEKSVVDLLGSVGNFVRLVDDRGQFHVKGVTSRSASSPDELLDIISSAKRRLARSASIRKSEDRNAYLFCQMSVFHRGVEGVLTLVECPPEESMVGNMSGNLIDCLRERSNGYIGNYQFAKACDAAKLTKATLADRSSNIVTVATVSPAATRTEETLRTLFSVEEAMGNDTREIGNLPPQSNSYTFEACQPQENISPTCFGSAYALSLPRQWSRDELVDWMQKKHLMGNPVPSDVNGRFVMRMSKRQLKNTFYDVTDDMKAEKLFMALRAENDLRARMRVKIRMAREREQHSSTPISNSIS